MKYRFIVRAKNSVGYSAYSYQTIIVAARLPDAPTLITKDIQKSNKTSITVQWTKVPDTETETSGYILMMAEFGSLQF